MRFDYRTTEGGRQAGRLSSQGICKVKRRGQGVGADLSVRPGPNCAPTKAYTQVRPYALSSSLDFAAALLKLVEPLDLPRTEIYNGYTSDIRFQRELRVSKGCLRF